MSGQVQKVTVNSEGQPIHLEVKRMAIYHRMKIVELMNESQETVYLFFYKDQFLTGKEIKMKKNSHLSKAFKHGIVFTSPHPLIDGFLRKDQVFQFKSTNLVFKALLKQYSQQEVALILSFFDSFLSKDKINEVMKKFFYDYRRNGQYRLAFQILMIVRLFDSKNTMLELSNSLEYSKHKILYDLNDPTLQANDPLYAEIMSFKKRANDPYFSNLQTTLAQEYRWMDVIAIYIDQITNGTIPTEQQFPAFIKLISARFSEQDRIYMLSNLSIQSTKLQTELVKLLENQARYEDAINVLIDDRTETSNVSIHGQLLNMLEKDTLQVEQIELENLSTYLQNEQKLKNIEEILYSFIPKFLNKAELTDVHDWLQPLFQFDESLPILKTIQEMKTIKDDPDQQLTLGKMYHRLQQHQHAIDCFNWEMEMNPRDPEPVQWLTKVYLELGMVEESANYKYIYSSMRKISG
ncbi:tetratricopeptide repeat protein [Metabacillus herbersteinensis]|uniref:Tetratricopeptide repeat protein n=1 Tax=Metabacillus herbersteinensis TaxID=283816 RepID=A0ABV6GHQ1_9BACI